MLETTMKYLKESKEREALSVMSDIEYSTLKRAYYGVADNIEQLGKSLNAVNGKTGLFDEDLKNIVKARDAFRKLKLERYGL